MRRKITIIYALKSLAFNDSPLQIYYIKMKILQVLHGTWKYCMK